MSPSFFAINFLLNFAGAAVVSLGSVCFTSHHLLQKKFTPLVVCSKATARIIVLLSQDFYPDPPSICTDPFRPSPTPFHHPILFRKQEEPEFSKRAYIRLSTWRHWRWERRNLMPGLLKDELAQTQRNVSATVRQSSLLLGRSVMKLHPS